MTQRIAVLGATGSIGDSTLSILESHPQQYDIYALSGHGRLDKLLSLCKKYKPSRVCVPEDKQQQFLAQLHAQDISCDVVSGQAGLNDIAADSRVDTVVAAIVGAAGLASTLKAANAGKRILLANKEALVMAGSLMTQAVRNNGATLLPLDSEHNAIFQCLPPAVQHDSAKIHDGCHGIKKLWLTASGGPFLHKSLQEMQIASVSDAVKHPNWSMGQKISVDSATMMNKGLELIEACHLFDLDESEINVVIHPQSIIHSLVEYNDGSFLAQMGSPDMRTPIAHALAFPDRIEAGVASLDLYALSALEFIKPDVDKFLCLKLARQAMQAGQAATIVLNAVNEVTVSAFLAEKIALTDIGLINERVLNQMLTYKNSDKAVSSNRNIADDIKHVMNHPIQELKDILAIDTLARKQAEIEVASCRL